MVLHNVVLFPNAAAMLYIPQEKKLNSHTHYLFNLSIS